MTDRTPTGGGSGRLGRILVPLDGSDASRAALTYATKLPSNELILLHVAVDDEVIVPEWAHEWANGDTSATSIDAVLNDLARELRTEDRVVRVESRVGDVAEEIIDAGRDADLIVMMTHGRGAASRILFGSIADRVMRHGQTPTLLLRAGELTKSPIEPKRVVITLDGSRLAEQAIPLGQRLAAACNLPVLLVRAVGEEEVRQALRDYRRAGVAPFKQPPTLYQDTHDEIVGRAQAYLTERADALRARGLEVECKVLEGTAAFMIIWETTAEDILVLATRGVGGFKRWSIGSVVEKVVREAPCPVLLQRVVRDNPDA